MKSILLQVDKQQELPKLFENLPYSCKVTFSVIITVDKDVIQINDNEDVKFISKNLVDISLEAYFFFFF